MALVVFETGRLGARRDVAEAMLLHYLLEVAVVWKVRVFELGRWGCGRQASRCGYFHSAYAAVVAGFAFG